MLSDMELINLQAVVSFRYDAGGRMLGINEPEPDQPAPLLFLGRTTAGNIWRFRHDLPDSLIHDLEHLLHAEPNASNLSQPPRVLPDVMEVLEAHSPIRSISMGPAWTFPDQLEPAEGVVSITGSNLGVMQRHYPWTAAHLRELQPCRAVIADGEAVSLCFSSRNGPEAAAAGVDTVEAFRG